MLAITMMALSLAADLIVHPQNVATNAKYISLLILLVVLITSTEETFRDTVLKAYIYFALIYSCILLFQSIAFHILFHLGYTSPYDWLVDIYRLSGETIHRGPQNWEPSYFSPFYLGFANLSDYISPLGIKIYRMCGLTIEPYFNGLFLFPSYVLSYEAFPFSTFGKLSRIIIFGAILATLSLSASACVVLFHLMKRIRARRLPFYALTIIVVVFALSGLFSGSDYWLERLGSIQHSLFGRKQSDLPELAGLELLQYNLTSIEGIEDFHVPQFLILTTYIKYGLVVLSTYILFLGYLSLNSLKEFSRNNKMLGSFGLTYIILIQKFPELFFPIQIFVFYLVLSGQGFLKGSEEKINDQSV